MTQRLESLQATWALSNPAFSLLLHVVLVVGGGVVVGVGGIVGVGNLTKICTNLWPPLIASGVEHFGRFIGGGFLDVDARVKQPWFPFPFSQPSSLWPPGCPSVVRRIDGLPGQPTPLPVVRVIGRSIHLQSDPADFAARIFHAHLSRDLFEFF